jgi:aconitate hydratase
MFIYDAAMKYIAQGTPTVVFGGEEYGSGSSRDWAAKGTLLLGVTAVIAESFERIHRSNLVNMGVLPLQFQAGASATTLGLTGRERYEVSGIAQTLKPGGLISVCAFGEADKKIEFQAIARIDTPEELVAFRHGGILPYVLRQLVGKK